MQKEEILNAEIIEEKEIKKGILTPVLEIPKIEKEKKGILEKIEDGLNSDIFFYSFPVTLLSIAGVGIYGIVELASGIDFTMQMPKFDIGIWEILGGFLLTFLFLLIPYLNFSHSENRCEKKMEEREEKKEDKCCIIVCCGKEKSDETINL